MRKDDLIQAVAKAIYEASPRNKPYSLLTAWKRAGFEREAQAAIAAIDAWRFEVAGIDHPAPDDTGRAG